MLFEPPSPIIYKKYEAASSFNTPKKFEKKRKEIALNEENAQNLYSNSAVLE